MCTNHSWRNDTQHYGTEHNNKSMATLIIMALDTEFCYAKFRKKAIYDECRYAECLGAQQFTLSCVTNVIKHFTAVSYEFHNKLERLSLASLSSQV
jgi:hypothetical protein